ncbi:MAG: arsenate reductase (glutaredoxin) [Xanthobacteraceae bacterium]|nr:MAG: arsenate reductase (glutaredoxin) [Xanthobacteraceae bacterium]
MKATIWHNPNCSTSRKVLDLLRQRGIAPEIVDYLKTPPDAAAIRTVLAEAGLSARDLMRRKGETYEALGLADPKWSEAELVAAMAAHPVLIERPVVRTAKGTRLCRPVERVEEIL